MKVALKIDETKKFLLTVGIALGILLLMLGYDSSVRQEAAEAREDNQSKIEELEDTIDKFSGLEGSARKKNEVFKKESFPGINVKLEFPDTLSQPPEGVDPAFHLGQELKNIQGRAKNEARRKNITIPETNWDIRDKIKKNNTKQEVNELRLRLAATSALVNKCIESKVRRIRKLQHKEVTIEVVEGTTTVVRRLPFLVEIEGDLYSLASVMLSFHKEGDFLEMQDCEINDLPGQDILLAKLRLAALRVLDRSQLKDEGRELPPVRKEGGGRTPPRRRPGRRRY